MPTMIRALSVVSLISLAGCSRPAEPAAPSSAARAATTAAPLASNAPRAPREGYHVEFALRTTDGGASTNEKILVYTSAGSPAEVHFGTNASMPAPGAAVDALALRRVGSWFKIDVYNEGAVTLINVMAALRPADAASPDVDKFESQVTSVVVLDKRMSLLSFDAGKKRYEISVTVKKAT